MVRIGVIGYGYWGPNIVRNFTKTAGLNVTTVCDHDCSQRKKAHAHFPGVAVEMDWRKVVRSPEIDAVAVVTPVSTHYTIAREALLNGKHVFVEKPFTHSSAKARELIEIAEQKHLVIMVDHTFLFTGAVRKIKNLMDRKALGDIYYYDSTRVNLGLFQHDANVIWDLAPHDFSIMFYLLDKAPETLSAHGKRHVNDFEDVAYITVCFPGTAMLAHFNVNWLSPVKIRTTLIGGKKRMLVWDDLSADEKIRIYDRGINVKSREGIYDLLVSYRSGDMLAPKVDHLEALQLESRHFLDCIEGKARPVSGGDVGWQVVRMLEACDESLRNNGKMVKV